MVVLKFGGTSVRDATWIDKALDIANDYLDRAPVLVASAMGKTTDRLQEIANLTECGERNKAEEVFKALKKAHISVVDEFLTGDIRNECIEKVNGLFDELRSIVKGLSLLKECTPRSNDMILSFGELLSTTIIAYRARERGIDTTFIDSREIIKTDGGFSKAVPIFKQTNILIKDKIKPERGKLSVAQGFIGSTESGITTTLGRGGSDYTAAIIGAALSAEQIVIWTDVDGIMSSDPRTVQKASTIPKISYKEAAELAYFGAKVIHPSAIQPATKIDIPIIVKNTGNPSGSGTEIIKNVTCEGPKAIAFKKGITLISITSYRMLFAYGFLRRIFEIYEKYNTSVDLISTSEVSVSMTIDDTIHLKGIKTELENIGSVGIEENKSIICLVGQGLWRDSLFISKVFSNLKHIPIRMISLGASDTNLSFVVPDSEAENTIQILHKEFFE